MSVFAQFNGNFTLHTDDLYEKNGYIYVAWFLQKSEYDSVILPVYILVHTLLHDNESNLKNIENKHQ